MTDGITIGQAASFAGVTVKTVRHYHKHGLIDEPRRDHSGYRRYGSADPLRLLQIRTLAAAGVPLAEIRAILDADPDRFAAALADVERRLNDRIDDLIARRDMLRRLATGDRALPPDGVLAKLDKAAAEFGFTPDDVTMAREGLVLIRALAPEGFDDHVSRVERALDDPRDVSLIKRMWRAAEWEPDDPGLTSSPQAWPTTVSPIPRCCPSRPDSRPAPTPRSATACSATTDKSRSRPGLG
ncbi:MerR family transcriptional regulator [Nonomuraea sp. JJY05]|uniref:MerR family transcriptional regulator n=1 Tax=Nonomuraea sp. JJY05 TaxID=3350255 RepID=UPI00373F95B6